MQTDESIRSIEQPADRATAEITAGEAAQALSHGPIGALVIASIAVGLLFIAWLLFYFLLFIPRGEIG
jgi:cytochrome b